MSVVEGLDAAKGKFGAKAAREVVALLKRAGQTRFRNPQELIQFHETVLFLRAYPQSARVLREADRILDSFAGRLRGMPGEEFEYAEISGIAGTGLSTNFSYPFAKSLAQRHGGNVRLDWAQYQHSDRLGPILARLIPQSFEDWAIGPHPDWRSWYQKAGGTLPWLIAGATPEVYDLLELPVRWELAETGASRSSARLARKKIFYHDGPFLARKDVSIKTEFASPKIAIHRLPGGKARRVLDVIVDASAVRYRELYGFLYPDAANVFHADLGRGVDFYFFGVARKWKLPRREYRAGMYFKNGVPLGYVEVLWPRRQKGGRMEVGFNLYYTFRQGETAWLYARLLKLFHERFRLGSFFIDPYQLGHENEEAIESGSFWFYYKLGFRPEAPEVARLAERELQKIAADPGYRTGPALLRKLASVPVVYAVS
ncbi:MAG: hypothetical protein M3N41_09095 [Acidobacteriota bacterium]|nr:hypothetical protein [Acidobacteriota bacterium]